jgi:hypothetical protein
VEPRCFGIQNPFALPDIYNEKRRVRWGQPKNSIYRRAESQERRQKLQKLQKLKRPEAEIRAKQPKNSLYRALLAAMAGVLKALEIPGGTAPGGVEAPKSARGLRAAYVAGTACGGHEVLGDELVCTVKDGAKSLE